MDRAVAREKLDQDIAKAWEVLGAGQSQYLGGQRFEPQFVAEIEGVHTNLIGHLVKMEDGQAVTFTCPDLRLSLRFIEQALTDLIAAAAEREAQNGQQPSQAVKHRREDRRGSLSLH